MTLRHLFKEVGYIFKSGAIEFREKLLLYSLETCYKCKFVQNEKARVAIKCIHEEEKGCNWSIHKEEKGCNQKQESSNCNPFLPCEWMGFFMINKMDSNQTYGAPCKDKRKRHYISNLVKGVILQDVQDQPLLKLKDIRHKFMYDYGIELSCYFAYAEKQTIMIDIYGDDLVSYHHLYSYMN